MRNALSREKGSYVLILKMKNPALIQTGKLGMIGFPRGWYAYAGSAMGSGGLAGRIGRHLNSEKKLHWHIDYLSRLADITEIWYRAGTARMEHAWAEVLGELQGAAVVAEKFGSSDCRCRTHLFHFKRKPVFHRIQKYFDPGPKPDRNENPGFGLLKRRHP
jgi:Uri superfamily endonuclease